MILILKSRPGNTISATAWRGIHSVSRDVVGHIGPQDLDYAGDVEAEDRGRLNPVEDFDDFPCRQINVRDGGQSIGFSPTACTLTRISSAPGVGMVGRSWRTGYSRSTIRAHNVISYSSGKQKLFESCSCESYVSRERQEHMRADSDS
jgi:hypothetical protein